MSQSNAQDLIACVNCGATGRTFRKLSEWDRWDGIRNRSVTDYVCFPSCEEQAAKERTRNVRKLFTLGLKSRSAQKIYMSKPHERRRIIVDAKVAAGKRKSKKGRKK